MNRRKVILPIFALALALLTTGCSQIQLAISGYIEPSQTPATVRGQTEQNAVFGSWDGSTYTNSYAGFGCQLDEDWVYQGAEEDGKRLSQTMDMQAENAKELATIHVLYTQLGFEERLTYGMLSQEEILDTLLTEQDTFAQRYTQQGTEVSSIEKLPVQFLGQEHFALKTETVTDGIPCYTVLIMDYTAGEYGVTLSVKSYLEDKTQQLLDLFYVVE